MMVLDILMEYVKVYPHNLRHWDIIKSILEANKLYKTSSDIKNLLQGYSMMNASMHSDLEAMGCTVILGKKHYKIMFHGDNRYQVAISKNDSDRRGFLNFVSDTNKIMF